MTPDGDLTLGASATAFVCAAFDYDLDVGEPLMESTPASGYF
jgi:hypothetical protein